MIKDQMTVKEFNESKLKIRKRKTYLELMGPEDHLQHQIVTWMDLVHPKIKYHHSPDAGKRTFFEQYKYSYLGGAAGYPDLTFFAIKLILECKAPGQYASKEQKEWLAYFDKLGWRVEVVRDYDEATAIINHEITKYNIKSR